MKNTMKITKREIITLAIGNIMKAEIQPNNRRFLFSKVENIVDNTIKEQFGDKVYVMRSWRESDANKKQNYIIHFDNDEKIAIRLVLTTKMVERNRWGNTYIIKNVEMDSDAVDSNLDKTFDEIFEENKRIRGEIESRIKDQFNKDLNDIMNKMNEVVELMKAGEQVPYSVEYHIKDIFNRYRDIQNKINSGEY